MKQKTISKALPADFPTSPAAIEAAIAQASKVAPFDPAADRYDPNNASQVDDVMRDAVVVHGGGIEAVRTALATRRGRGLGKKPAKALVSLRLSAEALERWKASGPGWQTRMAELLSQRAP